MRLLIPEESSTLAAYREPKALRFGDHRHNPHFFGKKSPLAHLYYMAFGKGKSPRINPSPQRGALRRAQPSRGWRICAGVGLACLLVINCSGTSTFDINLTNPNFPSGADASGADAMSSSTNFSQKAFDPKQKADPLSGAAYIPVPQMNNYGGVGFSYKLDIPAGRAGVDPKIALSYSSSGGDGWTGIGWNIGMGAITRTTRYGQLFYDQNDVFTYGGKRLYKVSGPVNSQNGVYRLEIDDGSLARFELTNAETGGVWKIFESSGSVTIYGENLSERVTQPADTSKTYAWQFSKTTDRNGNYLQAIYDSTEYSLNHILYLRELRYTGNAAQGMAANQFVRFNLKDRPSAGSGTEGYVSRAAGFAMKMTKLLDSIQIGWDPSTGSGQVLWDYELEYIISADSNRPLLKTIHSSRHATRPVFQYQAANHTLGWNQLTNVFAGDAQINPQLTQFVEGDFNGDGKSDFCFFNPENGDWKVIESIYTGGYAFKTYGNRFAGLKGQSQIQFFKGNVTGDFNGDGKSDVAMYLPEKKEFWIAESTGTNFNFRLYGKFILTNFDIMKAEWFTGDYNGDGLSDILLYDEESGDWIMMTATGTLQGQQMAFGFLFKKIGNQFQHLFRDDYSPGVGNNSSVTKDTSTLGKDRAKIQFFSGDYNGDGRSDIAFYDQRSGRWWVSNISAQVTSNVGVTDYSMSWLIYKVFTAPEQKLFAMDRFSGDYNGDGLSDFLLFDKANGDWWLGETVETPSTGSGQAPPPTINFRKWSSMPQNKEITRWFQGDFNGDGRSDVAFYSATDNNIWVGEATPNGFRYRIYNNLSFGGPNASVLANAPLPIDEVKVTDAMVFHSQGGVNQKVQYAFDGNPNDGRGELPFLGCFTGVGCDTQPELLIYDRKTGKFLFKKGSAAPVDTTLAMQLSATTKILTQSKPDTFTRESSKADEILYYQYDSSAGITTHKFNTLRFESAWQASTVAQITSDKIGGFNADESLYALDYFDTMPTTAGSKKKLLLLDDQALTNTGNATGAARFTIIDSAGNITPLIDNQTALAEADKLDLQKMLWQGASQNRLARNQYRIFTRSYTTTDKAFVFIVDMRTSPHKWYQGKIDLVSAQKTITLTRMAVNGSITDLPKNQSEEFVDAATGAKSVSLRTIDGYADSILYAVKSSSGISLSRISFSFPVSPAPSSVQIYQYGTLAADSSFNWEFDKDDKPIVRNANGAQLFDLQTPSTYQLVPLADGDVTKIEIKREDLYQKIYPYNWIQGDYNGDSKTDIGFFNLKESKWYLALTSGTVPDLIERVDNGIGGSYQFTYANSTSFDNTDDSGIAQLPMNYKVCTQLAVSDGQGHTYLNQYIYKKGFAYSAYLPSVIGAGGAHKETDYFGFSEFTAIDGLGSRTISEYNRAPFGTVLSAAIAQGQGQDFYLKNRALSGAIKKSTFIGWDNKEYSRTTYEYDIKKIQMDGAASATYFPVQTQSSKYVQNILVQSSANDVNLNAADFSVASRIASTTDNYSDAAHPAQTLTSRTIFERIADTNQERPTSAISLAGTPHETTTAYNYDANGNVAMEIHSYTGTGLAAVTPRTMVYQYDGYGNRVSSTNVSASPSRRSELVYDDKLFQFVSEERLLGNSIALTQKVVHNYAAAFGSPDSVADANNNKKYISYDALGRITRVKADVGPSTGSGAVATLSEFSYALTSADNDISPGSGFNGGALSAKTIQYTGPVTATAIAYDIKTRVFKDGVGRELHTLQSALDVPGKRYVKSGRRVYDALGRVTYQSQTDWAADDEFDALELRISIADKNPTRTDYDASGRVKKVTLPPAFAGEAETSMTTIYNDPWEVVTTHSIGQGKRTISNARGQTMFVEDFGAGGLAARMFFCYDIAGNRIRRGDTSAALSGSGDCTGSSGQNLSTWNFDAFGQLKTANDPDTGTSNYSYTPFSELAIKTDSLGRSTILTYDRLGRVTQKNPNGEGLVSYTYDTAPNGLGKLAAMDDAAQVKTFSYDRLGHRVSEARQMKVGTNTSYITSYRYDLLDRTYEIDYPKASGATEGARVCYGYSPNSQVGSITASTTQGQDGCQTNTKIIVNAIDYNEFGQMTKVVRGNGIATVYDYDVRGRVLNLGYEKNGVRYENKSYTYNVQNSITNIGTAVTSEAASDNFASYTGTLEYQYDGLNRLVHARGLAALQDVDQRKFEHNYVYTLNGNLQQKVIKDYDTQNIVDQWDYSYTNHKVGSITSSAHGGTRFALAYDTAGNLTAKNDNSIGKSMSISYNSYNRSTRITDTTTNAVVGQYSYDDQGFRVYKLSRQLADGQTHLYELETPNKYFAVERQKTPGGEAIPNTEYAVNNIYLDGVRVAAMVPTGQARWFMTDQVDSVSKVVNDNGDVISLINYLPYGETWYQVGDTGFSPKYNSQELDKESGLYFFNARHYDPELARFTTADSVVDGEFETAGWNRFMYVKGNPIMYKDPTGHWKEENYAVAERKGGQTYATSIEGGKVEEGDSLVKIAEKNLTEKLQTKNVTKEMVAKNVDFLRTINGLKNDTIQPGQYLLTNKPRTEIRDEAGMESQLLDLFSVGKIISMGAKSAAALASAATEGSAQLTKTGVLVLRNAGGQFVQQSSSNMLKSLANATPAARSVIGQQLGERFVTSAAIETAKIGTGVGATGKAVDYIVDGFVTPDPPRSVSGGAGNLTKYAIDKASSN
jgi:RHS repeat-associated protein